MESEHNIAHLEARMKELRTLLATMGDTTDFDELIVIIHRPGWTTIAEHLLVDGLVDAIQEHAKALTHLRQTLLHGSRAVELNPQPLPPGRS
ncbi:MAG TPA: hypothetical protein VKY19_26900 [Ktedonosporobacter sp.]|jgi:hypothetical protein|nr:hypothetical protein [Ktedonosporobacter sp.]